MYNTIEEFLQSNNNFIPIRYSYSDIKMMTNRFSEKLGKCMKFLLAWLKGSNIYIKVVTCKFYILTSSLTIFFLMSVDAQNGPANIESNLVMRCDG
ncbi:hypothetical protein L3X38_012204 [Prunus dulcis]|uniref:Uncharacterized protein n=1 Tax=Prunus dulcis TaxID=3755 RepID=A0AAD4WLN7_PRUDU|nr:hypothetical protein L3X38_012204 [Prunus dulcis]